MGRQCQPLKARFAPRNINRLMLGALEDSSLVARMHLQLTIRHHT
jgi:hypothetical protein